MAKEQNGNNVVLEKKWGSPTITNDGVTIAKEIELEDPFENMGAQMVREVASKTSDVAGDGTTTATVLAQALVEEGIDKDDSGKTLSTTTKQVKYSVFVPMLIKAIQEQQAIIEALRADVEQLKGN